MDSSQGWSRAQLRLKGIDADRNSLLEAYYMAALQKKTIIEIKRDKALMKAMMGSKEINEAFNKYLEEKLPSIAEGRSDFVEDGKAILDQFAGEVKRIKNE